MNETAPTPDDLKQLEGIVKQAISQTPHSSIQPMNSDDRQSLKKVRFDLQPGTASPAELAKLQEIAVAARTQVERGVLHNA